MYILEGLSKEELRDILISVLVFTLAFSIFSFRGGMLRILPFYDIIGISLAVAIFAFLLHELAHRVVARRFGGTAVYKMWPYGALLALIISTLGIIFAALGAVYINGVYDRDHLGKVSLAGPATNIAIGIVFFSAYSLTASTITGLVLLYVASLNFYMGFFNLLPIPPLDGFKIWSWNKQYSIISIGISLFLLVLSYVH